MTRDADRSERRGRARWVSLPLVAAVAAVVVAMVLPSPDQPWLAPDPGGSTRAPVLLRAVWPSAAPFTLDSTLSDGYSFQPFAVLDEFVSVGIATSPDMATTRVVVRAVRVTRELRRLGPAQVSAVAAMTVAGDQVFWVETGENSDGQRATSVWRAGLRSGPARQLAADNSDMVFFDSAFDLQVGDGRVYWAAARGRTGEQGEIRSVPVDGGAVQVRRFDRLLALSAWPWATTSAESEPGEAELLNLRTGERLTVAATANETLACGPAWCRVTTAKAEGLDYDLQRLDGTDRRRVGDQSSTPLNVDVALLDRFEVLASALSPNATVSAIRLWLYDLRADRTVLLADGATGAVGAMNGFVWWSTGDDDALAWHVLDLRQLS